MRKQWTLIVLVAILLGVSAQPGEAAQKHGRSTSAERESRTHELGSVEQFKDAFQNDAGKIRLVALISPT
jgi:hypothetical protein